MASVLGADIVLLYGQVVDVAEDSQWCGRISCKGWMINVLVV